MATYILIRYLHFVGILIVVGALFTELFLVKKEHTRKELAHISRIDGLYGMGAMMILAGGLLMWFAVGKPAEFYTKNWIFHAKVTLFVIVGLLSIWPTVFFIKQRKGDQNEIIQIPSGIRTTIRVEVGLMMVIPILAALMAVGIGSY